jgi:hypothetical protein
MKKDILTQRFNYGIITVYKDYSNISEKPAHLNPMNEITQVCGSTITEIDDDFKFTFSDQEDGVFNLNSFLTEPDKTSTLTDTLFLHGKKFGKRKNTKYFYNHEEAEAKVSIHSRQSNAHFTTSDRQIKRNYGNPFANINLFLLERSIRIDGDKICVRAYRQSKTRIVNCKYFKRRKTAIGFVFNLKTGNFITYDTSADKKSFRQNSFNHLSNVMSIIFDQSTITYFSLNNNKEQNSITRTEEKLKRELNDVEFSNHFFHVIAKHLKLNEKYFSHDLSGKSAQVNQFIDWVMKLFIEKNNIKAPNNYKEFLMEWYPTKPFLKRNENKLIVSILDRLGLKTKSMIKLMHRENFDIKKILLLAKYFGYKDISKYLSNIHPNFLDVKWKKDWATIHGIETSYHYFNNQFEYELTTREKTNLLKMINKIFGESLNFDGVWKDGQNEEAFNRVLSSQFRQFDDHFNMIAKIRKYIPETEMKATNEMDFHHEHLELSKIERTIRKGYSIQYTFEKRMLDFIERSIIGHTSDDETLTATGYYPVILKTDAQYSEEGEHMHHCVASYVDTENSLIVSIREDSQIGSERVTCEYNIKTKELIQAKYFCNAKPPERFENILTELTTRIQTFKGSIKSTGKEKIPLVINGIEISPPPKDEFMQMMDRLALF